MSTTDLGARDAAFAASAAAATKPAAPEKPEWHNLRAPDARTTLTAAVTVPAGRREMRAFLHNPNALFGLVFLGIMIVVAVLAPILFPSDPLGMVAKPFLWPGQDAAYLLDLYLDMVDATTRVREQVYRQFERRFAAHPRRFSAIEGAAGIHVPVLLIHDRDDEAVPPEHSTALAGLLPQGTLRLTTGLGHNRLLRDATTIEAAVGFVRVQLMRRTA